MKHIVRLVSLLITLSVLLSACNLPAPAASPTPDLLATQVLLALTTLPTGVAPSETPLPKPTTPNTAQPTLNTPTPESSPTATLNPTATFNPTATLTPAASDPAIALGSPAWQDTFSNGSNWNLSGEGYKDDYTQIKIENDALKLTSFTATGWRGWRLGGRKLGDGYLEVTLRTAACSSSDFYGLIARAPDYSSGQGYYVQLTCDGRYNFTAWDASGNRALFAPESHPALLGGSNQTNRIGLWMQGSTIKLYANGQLLREFEDSSLSAPGYFGLFIAGLSSAGFTYYADSIAYWNLP